MALAAPALATDKPAAPTITGAPAARVAGVRIAFGIRYVEGATLTCSWTGYHRGQGSAVGACSAVAIYAGGIYGSYAVGSTADGFTSSAFAANNLTAVNNPYTVSVTQTVGGVESDPATFSTVLDVISPERPTVTSVPTAIVDGSVGVTNSSSATFTFSSIANNSWPTDDGPAGFACNRDSQGWSDCTSPLTVNGLSDGSHTLSIRAYDATGNTSPVASRQWTVDTAAPSSPTVSSPDGSRFSSGTIVPFTATGEVGATLLCSIDSGQYVACPVAAGGPGDHSTMTVGYKTSLYFGQTGSPVLTGIGVVAAGQPNFVVFKTLANPTFASVDESLTGAPGGLGCSTFRGLLVSQFGSPVLALAASPTLYNIFQLDCSNTDASSPASAQPGAFTGLADGQHSLRVKAVDAAGNESAPSAAVSWRVGAADTTAPDAPVLTGAPASLTNSTGASIGFTGEADATFTCSVDGGSYSACGSSPKALSSLADGSHSLSVKATDQAGNTSTAVTASWTVDTTAPSAPELSGVPDSLTRIGSGQITFTGEAGSSFKCSQDGGSFVPCTSPLNWGGGVEGEHIPFRLTVKATDAAGNESEAASASWTVDTRAPDAPLLSGAHSGSTADTGASIGFSGEADASFICSVDGGSYEVCGSSPKVLSDLAVGAHSLSVKQADAAGNESAAATATWTVEAPAPPADTTAPDAPSITTNSVVSGAVRPAVEFAPTEVGGTVECRLNNGAWAACASPFVPVADLATGDYVFQVRQTDAASNVGEAASFSFHIAAPVITPTLPFAPVSFPVAPSWFMQGHNGHWQIKAAVSTAGDPRAAAQPLTVQLSTVAHPDSRLPSRATRRWKVVSYSEAFTWNGNWRIRPRWIRVGTKSGKWTAWTPLVRRSTD